MVIDMLATQLVSLSLIGWLGLLSGLFIVAGVVKAVETFNKFMRGYIRV